MNIWIDTSLRENEIKCSFRGSLLKKNQKIAKKLTIADVSQLHNVFLFSKLYGLLSKIHVNCN